MKEPGNNLLGIAGLLRQGVCSMCAALIGALGERKWVKVKKLLYLYSLNLHLANDCGVETGFRGLTGTEHGELGTGTGTSCTRLVINILRNEQ